MSHVEGGSAIRLTAWSKGGTARLLDPANPEILLDAPHQYVTTPYTDMPRRTSSEGIGPVEIQFVETQDTPQPKGPEDAS